MEVEGFCPQKVSDLSNFKPLKIVKFLIGDYLGFIWMIILLNDLFQILNKLGNSNLK
jgi:hypothetical protein